MKNEIRNIFNTYNETEQKEIITAIQINAIFGGGGCPTNAEEFKEFCEGVLKKAKKRARG